MSDPIEVLQRKKESLEVLIYAGRKDLQDVLDDINEQIKDKEKGKTIDVDR